MMMVLRSSKKLRACCSSSDWASLPEDLLVLILHRLIQLSDYFRFGAVCKPWHAAADHQKVHRRRDKQEVPMLLIPPPAKTAEEADYHCRRLYSVTQRKVLPNLELRVPYPRRCCGSSHGWLATWNQADAGITLLNPFSGKSFRFPKVSLRHSGLSHDFSYEFYVLKVVLSHDPSLVPNNDFVVAAIFGVSNTLAYIKPSDNHWTYMPKAYQQVMSCLRDVIYHLGKFYVVDAFSGIHSVDISSFSEPRVEELAPRTTTRADKAYLVKSCEGELLLVQRFLAVRRRRPTTSCFKIFKVLGSSAGIDGQIVERVEIYSLGDNTLFLGDNYSLSVSSLDFPGCRPNCIYFTDDSFDSNLPYYPCGSRDTGIYCLEDRSFVPHYRVTTKQKHVPIPPPVWIVPPLLL
ncbi:hypothetical protein RHMOL_Rhmol08G0326300 [Rhododendron molle]|uniref:Uncharacterized protein n=1 Tax=Rhododendron molle TaxID=49168 RepID=A0ACC0MUY0_RHOML|nr:hypothetical protein RHMOL_Rhmol08G0326300 [Rhododendron molle]